MKSKTWTRIIALALFAALAVPVQLAAQDKQDQPPKHHHYQLIDMGTFGGVSSSLNFYAHSLNDRGMVVGTSLIATPILPTSNGFNCPYTQIPKAFEWRDGAVHNLGTLENGNCSNAVEINAKGDIAGNSETADVDPITGFNVLRAVIWRNGEIRDLGTFGGNNGAAQSINNAGQVAGFALNDVLDPYSMFDLSIQGTPNGTQTRAFIWHDGKMKDLGTLGGPDAVGYMINERGQIAGFSYINGVPNTLTGLPEVHPFLWENGKMKDLGSFGGYGSPFGSVGINGINNRGQVIGTSPLSGEQGPDPFFWDGTTLIDMATQGAGGSFFDANVINNSGVVAGGASFPNRPNDAALWKDGVVTDLGFLPGDCYSEAWSINDRGQVGGTSVSCDGADWRAFLWEKGAMVDLNSLLPHGAPLQVVYAMSINDHNEIAGIGVTPGVSSADVETLGHAFLMIPCDENHSDIEGCDYSMVDAATAAAQSTAPRYVPSGSQHLPQSRRTNRYHLPGLGASQQN